MQFLNSESINLLLLVFGFVGLIFVLIYTAFSSEKIEDESA